MRRVNEVAFGNTKTIGGKNQVRRLDTPRPSCLSRAGLRQECCSEGMRSTRSVTARLTDLWRLEPTRGGRRIVAERTRPSWLGLTLMTLPMGHWFRGEDLFRTRTKSPTVGNTSTRRFPFVSFSKGVEILSMPSLPKLLGQVLDMTIATFTIG